MMVKIIITETVDIVALVQNNPLTRLSSDYGSKIIQKIQDRFTTDDQQWFVANHYCYLNYNQTTDFIINLDRIWKWLGYGRIEECKRVLTKNFKENVNYKIEKAAPQVGGAGLKVSVEGKNLGGAGHNREYITLTVNCFKKLCLKSRTDKADQIHDYYIGLEEILNELVTEQTEELQQKLINKDKQLKLKDSNREQNLIKNFDKKPVLYLGYTEKNIVKFGYTDGIKERLNEHKRDIGSHFTIEYIYESIYNREIERRIKRHPILSTKRTKKTYGSKPEPQTELIILDKNFTIKDLDQIITIIKKQVESGEYDTFQKEILELEKENSELRLEIEKLKKDDDAKFFEYRQQIENLKLQVENLQYDLKQKTYIINNADIKVVDIQLNSMEDLNLRLQEIKKAVCYNFLVDLVAKEIISNSGNKDLELKLSVHEIFERYIHFRKSNRYEDPVYCEKAEKSLITKVFNEVDGIRNTYKTVDGEQSRAKEFHISKIAEWICENLQVPKRFRNIFREISKEVIFTGNYHKILNEEIDDTIKHVYSFLIHLLNNENSDIFVIKKTILNELYLRFVMQCNQKKLTISNVYELFKDIPGIHLKQRITDGDSKFCKGFEFNKHEINEWIKEYLVTEST